MTSTEDLFPLYEQRMRAAALPEAAIESFRFYYRKLAGGETGLVAESSITPVSVLPDAENFSEEVAAAGRSVLGKTVVVKLNGGLGTSMGLDGPKSLLAIKDGLSFLEIAAGQSANLGAATVLMDSFATHEPTLAALRANRTLEQKIFLTFQQHKVPKVLKADLRPADWPQDRRLEWCPPGHGDIYAALMTSGVLEKLLREGYEYAFVSNIDNLGAYLDEALLGYFHSANCSFMLEAAERTEADNKGGHLARLQDGRLILRERAQCPSDELEYFQDIGRHKFFNTNNIWLRLRSIEALLEKHDSVVKLPMIRNVKPIDPRQVDSPQVFQLETAMGAAIELFDDAIAVRVPRSRLVPVKTTEDLLRIRSDVFCLTDGLRVIPNPERKCGNIVIRLHPTYYALIDDFEARFPHGPPSLLECESLDIRGNVTFGRNVRLRGRVELGDGSSPLNIADGTTIDGEG